MELELEDNSGGGEGTEGESEGMATRSSSKPKPLSSVSALTARFAECRQFGAQKHFGKGAFKDKADKHIERHNMKQLNRNNGGDGERTVVVNQVATFADNTFFRRPTDTGAKFSVCGGAGAARAKRHGYVEVNVDHYTDPDSIPILLARNEERSHANLSDDELLATPVPTTLTMYLDPTKTKKRLIPNLFINNRHKDEEETISEAVVRAFEVAVIDPSAGEDVRVFSPYREWTDEERKKACVADSKFTKLCKAYFAIRAKHASAEPANIRLNMKGLVEKAGGVSSGSSWYKMAVGEWERIEREKEAAINV
uniref:Uncharacterized protein n=1 Tax=Minutocellus polymorphus TaxID=265543 RepID=A0A7S0AYI2_9STRA|mmetsp:Transcript_7064/g.11775  ORF Transcript_7064/g.11775 Transcript_7064/m.11775 type:complete len:310 (+) Transcript_7064:29-958(+)